MLFLRLTHISIWIPLLESDMKNSGQGMNIWVKNSYLELKANPEIEFSGLGMEGLQESATVLVCSAVTAFRTPTKLSRNKQGGPAICLWSSTKQTLSFLYLSEPTMGPQGIDPGCLLASNAPWVITISPSKLEAGT